MHCHVRGSCVGHGHAATRRIWRRDACGGVGKRNRESAAMAKHVKSRFGGGITGSAALEAAWRAGCPRSQQRRGRPRACPPGADSPPDRRAATRGAPTKIIHQKSSPSGRIIPVPLASCRQRAAYLLEYCRVGEITHRHCLCGTRYCSAGCKMPTCGKCGGSPTCC
jgi:hypothetical protein